MRRTNWTTTIPALLLCLLGAFFSGHLLARHVGNKASGLLPFLCGIQEDTGCDRVLESRWAVFPPAPAETPETEIVAAPGGAAEEGRGEASWADLRLPVAMLGLCYFVFLCVWWLFIGRPSWDRRKWHLVPITVVVLGCAMSAWFIMIMASEIGVTCKLCLATHGVNFVLIVFVLLAWPMKPVESASSDEAPTPSHPTLRLAVTALALGLAGCTIVWQASTRQALQAEKEANAKLLKKFLGDMDFLVELLFRKEPRSIRCRDDDFIVRAEPGARVQLVLFTDFQCSACILFTNELLKKHVSKFDGHLDVALKHFPLCKDCNEHVDKELHPYSCEAAYLAEAVRMQGGVEALLKTIDFISLERRDPYSAEDIATIAGLAGLDPEQLEKDRQSEAVRTRVQEDIKLGASLDVPGTPTAFLEGRMIDPVAGRVDAFWEALTQFRE